MLFAALDADGDGVITRAEMREGFAGGTNSGGGDALDGGLGAAGRSVMRGSAVGDSASQWYVLPVAYSAVRLSQLTCGYVFGPGRRYGESARDYGGGGSSPVGGGGKALSEAQSVSPSYSHGGASYTSRGSRGEDMLKAKLSEITKENQAMAYAIRSETSSP